MSQSPYVIIAGLNHVRHMLVKSQRTVKSDTEHLECVDEIHCDVTDVDRDGTRFVRDETLTNAEYDSFGF